ncbi:hypothetical protein COOONC_05593 [Cooperia oncophora]
MHKILGRRPSVSPRSRSQKSVRAESSIRSQKSVRAESSIRSQKSVREESSIRTARAATPRDSSRALRPTTPRAARPTTPKDSSRALRPTTPRALRARTPRVRRSTTPKLMDACPSGSLHSNFQIYLPPRQPSQPTKIPITKKSTDSSVRTARASTPKKTSPPKPIGQSRLIKKPAPTAPLRKPAVAKKPSPPVPKRDTTVSTTTTEVRRKVLANDMTSPTAHHTKLPYPALFGSRMRQTCNVLHLMEDHPVRQLKPLLQRLQ